MRKGILSSGNHGPLAGRANERLASALVVLAAAGVAGLSFLLRRPPLPFPRCLFRWITGWPCPSCGLTRAFIALGHGRLAEAFFDNIMSPVLFAALAAILIMALYETLTGRYFLRALWNRMKSRILIAVLTMALISWAWNIYKTLAHLSA